MSTQKIQRCCACNEPTGRCEEDAIYLPPKDPNGSDLGPLCEACCDERDPPNPELPRGGSPRAWAIFVDGGNARMWSTFQPHVKKLADAEGLEVTPLYDQATLEATADDAARLAREAEAHYWRSMVDRLTAQADEWNRRYMALMQQVVDDRAMQPAPAILVDLGPNIMYTANPSGYSGDDPASY